MTRFKTEKFQWNYRDVDDYMEIPMTTAIRIRDFIEAYDQWVNSHPEHIGETCKECVSDETQGYVSTHGEYAQFMRTKI